MKLRIRYDGKTAILKLENNQVTIGEVKNKILESLTDNLQLSSTTEFDLTLDGKLSLGSDSTKISTTDVVSGDLIKIAKVDRLESGEESSQISSETSMASTSNAQTLIGQTTDIPKKTLLLLSDYKEGDKLPSILKEMFEKNAIKNEFHAICVALHLLMMESGFTLETPADEFASALQGHMAYLEYSHAGADTLVFAMTCTPLGQFVLVNGIVKQCTNTQEKVLSLQINTTEYVQTFNMEGKPIDENAVFKNLSRLSYVFKENIAHQALNVMREELQLPPLHGILSLFPDLLKRIFSSLDFKALCTVSQTCTTLANIANDDDLWRALFTRDFGSEPTRPTTISVKQLYKRQYMEKKEQERQRLEHERDFFNDYRQPAFAVPDPDFPSPFPGQPAGMIGGDYDLNPSFPYGPLANPGRGRHPMRPVRPGMPGGGNPLPGSRFDPINPFGTGRFRPGRGGGMMDDDYGFPQRRRNRPSDRGFGGGFL